MHIASLTANITIFYYMSNALKDFDKGVPVVLNFSDSCNFLKCVTEKGKPCLTVEVRKYPFWNVNMQRKKDIS